MFKIYEHKTYELNKKIKIVWSNRDGKYYGNPMMLVSMWVP